MRALSTKSLISSFCFVTSIFFMRFKIGLNSSDNKSSIILYVDKIYPVFVNLLKIKTFLCSSSLYILLPKSSKKLFNFLLFNKRLDLNLIISSLYLFSASIFSFFFFNSICLIILFSFFIFIFSNFNLYII